MQAMILAAGLGTRLQPYSNIRPKPLFPILNQPLILLTIECLQKAGFDKIVINTHHLSKQIIETVQDISGIILQQEEVILGTGGGLRRAFSSFSKEPVLVVNADIYHDIDYAVIYYRHQRDNHCVSLVLHDSPRYNNVSINENQHITNFGCNNNNLNLLAFTGIHVINPEILTIISPEIYSSIIECYRTLIRRGETVQGLVLNNLYWTDMGSPSDYLHLHEGLLKGKIPAYPSLKKDAMEGPNYIAKDAIIGDKVEMNDWVSIGSFANVGSGTELTRVVVWDGATLAPGSILSDTIVTG